MATFKQGEVRARSTVVPLDQFSLSATSGWRAANVHVIASFESKFPDQFGKSIFRNVRAHVDEHGAWRTDSQGILLVDGRSTLEALRNLHAKFVLVGV